jgi:hypothetical protein
MNGEIDETLDANEAIGLGFQLESTQTAINEVVDALFAN